MIYVIHFDNWPKLSFILTLVMGWNQLKVKLHGNRSNLQKKARQSLCCLVWSHNSLISHLVKTYFQTAHSAQAAPAAHTTVSALCYIFPTKTRKIFGDVSESDNIFKKQHIAFVWMGGWKLYFSTIWKMLVFIPFVETIEQDIDPEQEIPINRGFYQPPPAAGTVACLGLICQVC